MTEQQKDTITVLHNIYIFKNWTEFLLKSWSRACLFSIVHMHLISRIICQSSEGKSTHMIKLTKQYNIDITQTL